MSRALGTVLVTGAAGTVGSSVAALAETAGFRVIVNGRHAGSMRTPARGEVRAGDFSDPATAERLVRGCNIVIHTAAQLDVGADIPEISRVNTDGVVLLYEAGRRAGVRRFVHMSTGLLYGAGQVGPLSERAIVAPRGAHGLSKHGAEVFLTGCKDGPEWVILRAGPIYGRRGRHFAASLLAIGPILQLATPVLPRFYGGPLSTMAHAEDVARALLFVATHERVAGEVFNVASEAPVSLGDRITETFRAYGLRVAGGVTASRRVGERARDLLRRPPSYRGLDTLLLAAWKLVVLRHRLKPALRPRLDREAVTLFCDELVLDTSKLRALGWSPRFPAFAEGWRAVLRWYQAERWVPRFSS